MAPCVSDGQPGWHFPWPRSRSRPLAAFGTAEYPMKRIATWAFYGVGALAIAYLALYAYAMFSGQPVIIPGDPIHIFRKPDAPSYS